MDYTKDRKSIDEILEFLKSRRFDGGPYTPEEFEKYLHDHAERLQAALNRDIAVRNAANRHETLVEVSEWIGVIKDFVPGAKPIGEKVKAALAEPPRVCDILPEDTLIETLTKSNDVLSVGNGSMQAFKPLIDVVITATIKSAYALCPKKGGGND